MRYYLFWAGCLLVSAIIPWRWEAAELKVGSKAFTEGVILGELLQQLSLDAGVPAEHLRHLGGSRLVFQALKQQDIVAYVEYTGTIDQELLAETPIANDKQRAEVLAEHGIMISPSLGFNNTYAIAMRREQAEQLGIVSITDLARHRQLKYGLSNEFIDRGDGWPALSQRYALPTEHVFGLDHDLAYRQLRAGEIDVMDAYVTDARIDLAELILLQDDKKHFPEYSAVILYSSQMAERYPQLVAAWLRLIGQIHEDSMRRMNGDVEFNHLDESQVAADFLNERLQIVYQPPVQTRDQRVVQHILEHLDLVRRSLLPAILIAIPLGVIAFHWRLLGQTILGITSIVQTIPALALLVMLIPVSNWLGASSVGRGSITAVMALFFYSLLPVVRNTFAGLNDVPAFYRDSAQALGLSPFWRLSYVELPLATRSVLAGIKTAAVLNIGYATLGALIGAGGLGQPILTGIRLNRFDLILEGALPAALLALAAQAMFEFLERRVLSKGLK